MEQAKRDVAFLTVTLQFSEDDIRMILQTAVDAGHTFGIGYWAADLTWNDSGPLVATLYEHDDTRDRKKWKHHMLDLARGVRMTLLEPPVGWSIDNGELFVDGPAADYFIQFAALGEQKYG